MVFNQMIKRSITIITCALTMSIAGWLMRTVLLLPELKLKIQLRLEAIN